MTMINTMQRRTAYDLFYYTDLLELDVLNSGSDIINQKI
jgi:hypothetical protein